ncbi:MULTISPECIES: ABC transporter permease [Metabacillus]|uniref:Transport permease protein n=2 Tax=Metabacillus TaxID=2675233 RepID=A0A179T2P8_9BACI|nr:MULTISPECIES: ABC transporter permease [Metabacillus]OAS88215.1 Teichoic acid translocation permease TagG [Metabacillus litoralis]QNF27353.1 ABC transporter permease [Metabacillus sp. KUDC1714]
MTPVSQVIKEQFSNMHLIFRLAAYETKSKNQMNYLGVLWQILNPVLQVAIYWFVFGLGIRQGTPVGDTPFFVWFLIGLIPWFFISPSIVQGSNSVYAKINVVSKMKFPVSVLPTITIVSNAFNFIIMMLVLGAILVLYQIQPGLYMIQLPYFLISLFIFLFAFTLLCSTISIIIRDFQVAIQSVMRIMFFLLPVLWDTNRLDPLYQTILKINPVYYIIEGFRDTLLGRKWFFEDLNYTIYFWSITFLILIIGASIHVKFRDKFVDYL